MADIEQLRKQMIDAAKKKVTQKYEDKDIHIIKSVNILEDIDPISNLLTEQLREWHSVHFPELNDLVKGNDVYTKLVSKIGKREDFFEKKILEHIEDPELARQIAQAAITSIGSAVSPEDLAEMKTLAMNCLNLSQERDYLAKYLEETMKRELPNFTELAGPVIGAKILAKLGSKKRLAFAPASTIQMVGAEKALFMHFRKGVKGPKYGYLFQHPLVKAATDYHKGKIARSLAAKLAIAAKKDYFGNTSDASDLQKQLDERIMAIGKMVNLKPKAPVVRTGFREFRDDKPRQWKREERPRGDFKPRADFAPRADFVPRQDFKPRADFVPRTESNYEQRSSRNNYPARTGFDRPARAPYRSEGSGFAPRRDFSAGRRPAREGGFGERKSFGPRTERPHSGPRRDFGDKPFRREGARAPETGERSFTERAPRAHPGHSMERKPFSQESGLNRPFGARTRKGGRKQWGSKSKR